MTARKEYPSGRFAYDSAFVMYFPLWGGHRPAGRQRAARSPLPDYARHVWSARPQVYGPAEGSNRILKLSIDAKKTFMDKFRCLYMQIKMNVAIIL